MSEVKVYAVEGEQIKESSFGCGWKRDYSYVSESGEPVEIQQVSRDAVGTLTGKKKAELIELQVLEDLRTRLLLAHEKELTTMREEFNTFRLQVARALKDAGFPLALVNAAVAGQVPREERPQSVSTEQHQTINDVHDFAIADTLADYEETQVAKEAQSSTDGEVEASVKTVGKIPNSLSNSALMVKWASTRTEDLCADCGQIHDGNRIVDERGKIVKDPKPCPPKS